MMERADRERVHSEVTSEIEHAAMMPQMKVLDGWANMHTTLLVPAFRRDEILKSLVFVPESASTTPPS